MNKTALIIKREYLSRVRKKSFIITTVLVPLLFFGLIAGVAALAVGSVSTKHIAVRDESGKFAGKLKNEDKIVYEFSNQPLDSLRKNEQYDAVLHIPEFDAGKPSNFSLYSSKSVGIDAQQDLRSQLNDILVKERLQSVGISEKSLDSLQSNNITVTNIDKEGQSKSVEIAMGIGYVCGILLYMFMLLYGMGVMRSVMEEKTNRIAEIMVSSVKPFQLMMGKIIGAALVGLTQFAIWVGIMVLLSSIGISTLGPGIAADPEVMRQAGDAAQAGGAADPTGGMLSALTGYKDWLQVLLWFLFYFLGGYFLYASLFAAVGSLVNEDPQDAQQLTLPVTMPIIFAFIAMTVALREPNGNLAVFCSIFPLTSPVVMMARIPFGDVPGWQLALSAVCLLLGFIGTTWIAAKIYRTGILLYGKKITLREVGKWLIRK